MNDFPSRGGGAEGTGADERPQGQAGGNAAAAGLGAARWGFVAIGVFSFFLNLLMLVSPLYMMQVFDRVLASGRTENVDLP